MKKAAFILLAFMIAFEAAAEECEPAVDVAESLDVNASRNCNYKDSGLNRVVQGLFKRGQSSSMSSRNASVDRSGPVSNFVKVSPPLSDAESLARARYAMLSTMSQECVEGFRIADELYLPEQNQLVLRLVYECLNK